MATKRVDQLWEMQRHALLVRFSRRFEESPIRGYVLDIGPKFFLLALVSDRIWFDGFECFRISDVRDLKPDPYVNFVEAALKKRSERITKKPRVDLKGIAELLRSAARLFPLVTIHREGKRPDVCWIGRILGVQGGKVSLLEINPDATWDAKPTEYRLNEITRVDFGGDYENALHLVGGEPAWPTLAEQTRSARVVES
jgi:hypothetical protein